MASLDRYRRWERDHASDPHSPRALYLNKRAVMLIMVAGYVLTMVAAVVINVKMIALLTARTVSLQGRRVCAVGGSAALMPMYYVPIAAFETLLAVLAVARWIRERRSTYPAVGIMQALVRDSVVYFIVMDTAIEVPANLVVSSLTDLYATRYTAPHNIQAQPQKAKFNLASALFFVVILKRRYMAAVASLDGDLRTERDHPSDPDPARTCALPQRPPHDAPPRHELPARHGRSHLPRPANRSLAHKSVRLVLSRTPLLMPAYYIPIAVFETLVAVLAVARWTHECRDVYAPKGFLQALVYDSVVYFSVMTLAYITNIVMWIAIPVCTLSILTPSCKLDVALMRAEDARASHGARHGAVMRRGQPAAAQHPQTAAGHRAGHDARLLGLREVDDGQFGLTVCVWEAGWQDSA
ncbi:hypothetical protein EWM64_g5568 [Hericium alpestre]|uniref:Uncharacterized protein n=1 Tax=Hericium alpestre TaxID=135208 RepID=A0A4Y9ZW79_9AGAM|nr:hypothetical protein EWM64_g5568 [Hericium alpestre]